MNLKEIQLIGDKENQEPMAKYMKNKFVFLGVKAPDRKTQSKEWLKQSKELSLSNLYEVVESLYQRAEREYHYVAIEICEANVKRFTWDELKKYSRFIQEKSWWDSVDSWRKVYGLYLKIHPEERVEMFHHFYKHEDMWMRRVSITLQLMEKGQTDQDLLTKAILYDKRTDEFFIQKAIGWSLRQYAKVNPDWVIRFVETNDLTTFASKEAIFIDF